MSLDISLINRENNEEALEMNWLRNPFGLCNWAMDNTYPLNKTLKRSLWYVINHWNYQKSYRVNRPLFLEVVNEHWKVIKDLEQGYFYFNLPSYRQFIEPKLHLLPVKQFNYGSSWIEGTQYSNDGLSRLMIPIEMLQVGFDLSPNVSLQSYKDWFYQLVEFAELLQDQRYRYYCSN